MSSSFIGKVLDNYRIIERLGTGGMGVVFKAIHIKLEKVVALKIISPSLSMNENFLRRFESEAKALAKLEDQNIVRIYDLRSDSDRWFIVMEYVEGTTLARMTEKYVKFPWKKCLPLFKQMLSAIAHAHESGIIHRDIKPNNIMLTDEGVVKITDFGLAKDTTVTNTMTVTSGGTLHYMSPEHVKGFSFIDARSDIYSLGMTFYEMLTGVTPLKDITSDFEIREAIVRKDFDKPSKYDSTIPSALDDLVMKAIRKNPDERFQSADEMLDAIEQLEIRHKLTTELPQQRRRSSTSKVTVQRQKIATTLANTEETVQESKNKKFSFVRVTLAAAFVALIIYFFPQIKTYLTDLPGSSEQQNESSNLTVSTNPAAAFIFLNGDSIGQTPLQGYTIGAGTYRLSIRKQNFANVDTMITIAQSENTELEVTLNSVQTKPRIASTPTSTPSRKVETVRPQFASLIIRSSPAGASVHLNGTFRGAAPLRLNEIDPGAYVIELSLEGYEAYRENIRLNSGNTQVLQPRLQPYSGQIKITSAPASATVYLDGTRAGNASEPIKVPAGRHNIEVRNPGYTTFSSEVEVNRNLTTNIDAILTPMEGELSIQVRPWGSIYINGELKKKSAEIRYTLNLPVDRYMIKVEHPTLGYWQKQVQVENGKTTDVLVNFAKKISVQVSATDENGKPVFADIYVDGENTGKKSPEQIQIRVGVHKISLVKDGYTVLDGEKEILVQEGSDQQVSFSLKKNG